MKYMTTRKNDLFNDMFDDVFRAPVFTGNNILKTDVREKDGKYILEVEVPGYKKDEVSISLFNGNTGPFIQYTYARIRSILRKAEAENIAVPTTLSTDAPLNEKEIQLIQKLNEFGAAVEQAGKDYSPSGIANYCYELTKDFNQFYHDYSILNADTETEKITRLMLAKNVAKVIKNGMELLGIEVPERM